MEGDVIILDGNLKKTDRRTLYTKMVIKDALLELLATNSFEKITVTATCKQAEVSRATFYLHFDDLTAVLDECLADALKIADEADGNPHTDMLKMLQMITSGEFGTEMLQANDTLLPACQRVADLPKYRPIFLDSGLSDYIIKQMFQAEKDRTVPILMEHCHLPKVEAELLFAFVIYGAFSVNKSMGWNKNRKWYEIQGILIRFILGGLDVLKKEI